MPWLFGVGVAGGMALWSNPVKGAILGPLIAAAAAAFHQEGVQLMSSQHQAEEVQQAQEVPAQLIPNPSQSSKRKARQAQAISSGKGASSELRL
jgi:hypothetical protein